MPGREFLVDRVEGKPEVEVLMVVDGDKVEVGKPVLTGAKVALDVVTDMEKGKKIRVSTFKAKARIRKTRGHRAQFTRLVVKSIS